MSSPEILLIDDDRRLADMVGRYLGQAGFAVQHQGTAREGLAALGQQVPGLVLLDLMLPDGDGLDVCRQIRQMPGAAATVPVLMLTARGETTDRIVGLEIGADDYLPKPFEPRELLLRIGAILRRVPVVAVAQPKYLTLGALRYDTDKGELWNGDAPLRLTGTETALLRRLAASRGQPVSRADLIDDLGRGGGEDENGERAIDVQITRLRRKIEPDPREPRFLQTVRGTGYMLVVD